MKKIVFIFTIITGIILAGCSKTDNNLTLKQSVQESVSKINEAATVIGTTKGYQLLTLAGSSAKTDIGYADSITLGMVAGVYDYAPDTLFVPSMSAIPFRLFRKTGLSDKMIVNMPQKVIFHPKYLFGFYHSPDSAYNHNNFTITANDYHNYYSWYDRYDYKLAAGFSLNNENLGTLGLISKANRMDRSYSSQYTFAEGYKFDIEFESGDTTISSLELSDKITGPKAMTLWRPLPRHSAP
jgi:hypothetical protein